MSLDFSALQKESDRRADEAGVNMKPYIYKASDGTKIEIPFPKGDAYMALGQVEERDQATQFQILLDGNPKAYNTLMRDFSKLNVTAISIILEDIWEFWNTDIHTVPGKSEG